MGFIFFKNKLADTFGMSLTTSELSSVTFQEFCCAILNPDRRFKDLFKEGAEAAEVLKLVVECHGSLRDRVQKGHNQGVTIF